MEASVQAVVQVRQPLPLLLSAVRGLQLGAVVTEQMEDKVSPGTSRLARVIKF